MKNFSKYGYHQSEFGSICLEKVEAWEKKRFIWRKGNFLILEVVHDNPVADFVRMYLFRKDGAWIRKTIWSINDITSAEQKLKEVIFFITSS